MTLRVLLASSSTLANELLAELQRDTRIELIGVISTPDRPKGRHGTPTPNEFAAEIQRIGLPIYKPESHDELLAVIIDKQPDLVLVVAYGRLIRREALDAVPRGWINLHFSLLPRFRGAAPVQRALLQGERRFGITYFRIDEGMDTGPTILQREEAISDESCATEILELLARLGAATLSDLITFVLNGEEPIPQSAEASMAPKIRKEELALDLEAGKVQMARQLRAFTTRPGVWFHFEGRRCIVTQALPNQDVIPRSTITLERGKALLGTGDGAIEIVRVIPEGKREMTGVEWLRGLRFAEGEERTLGTTL